MVQPHLLYMVVKPKQIRIDGNVVNVNEDYGNLNSNNNNDNYIYLVMTKKF